LANGVAEESGTVGLLSAAGVGATDRSVDLPGRGHFHYVTAGSAGRPLLVFLHGLADSWRSAALLFRHLADDFEIAALDQRGHGETGDRFSSYEPGDFAADAAAFLKALGRPPAVLAGHSMGSLVAQDLAADLPETVSRLVLIGGADTAAGNAALQGLADELPRLPDPPPRSFVYDFQASTVHRPLPDGLLDAFVADSLKLSKRVWIETVRGLLATRPGPEPRRSIPTLIAWGEQDSVFDAAAQERLRKRFHPSTFVSYPETGHAPQWERPETVAASILAFARSSR
jgi:non-heme chloroperoxidase